MIAETLETRESESPATPQPATFTLSFDYNNGDPIMSWSPDSITVNQATANFTIALSSSSTPGAALTGRIKWFRGDVGHVLQPPMISNFALSTDGQTITFTDNNPQGNRTWRFIVWVSYNGTDYPSPDPTIINADI